MRHSTLILERWGREGEKEGEEHWCEIETFMCPDQGPNPQARHVPQPGTEPRTFAFTRGRSHQPSHISQGESPPFNTVIF